MADNVTLKIGADTKALEAAVEKAFTKINASAAKMKIPSMVPGAENLRQSMETKNTSDRRIRDEKAALELINATLRQKQSVLDNLTRAQDKQNKSLEQELQLKNKIAAAERDVQKTREYAQVKQVQYDTANQARNRMMGTGGGSAGGGAGGGTVAGGGFEGMMAQRALAGAAVYAAMKVGSSIEGVIRNYSEASHRAREMEASAFQMQGQGGQRIQNLLNGGTMEEFAFNPQRVQASRAADAEMQARLSSGGRMFLHPFQTMTGKSFAEGGLGTAGTVDKARQEQAIERNQIQQSQFEALQTGPEGALRTTLANQYNQSAAGNLAFQRQMGMSNAGFRGTATGPTGNMMGGFIPGVTGAGFSAEQGMGMASSIMGAGGSTRAAGGLAGFGLQAQRNLDMTNAGGVIGTLSKGLGGSETTKEAFVKILAEGTRAGLDGSEFRDENRKFVEMAAQAVSQSGVSSGAGVDQVMSQFGKFFGDKTGAGLSAGQGAYELYRQTSMSTSGPRGTMRAAGMLSDPTISKLSRDSREALFNMPIDQLTADNPAIIAMARQANVTPQQLIDAQNKITSSSSNQFAGSDRATAALSAVKRKYGVSSAIGFQGPLSPGAYDEMSVALGTSNIAQIKEHPELGQNQRLTSAYSNALSSGDVQGQNRALEEAKRAQIAGTGGTGRTEDENERLQAQTSKLANQLFNDVKDSIVPTTEAAREFAKEIIALRVAMQNGTVAEKAKAITDFNAGHPGMIPSNMPSAGAPSSGGGSGH